MKIISNLPFAAGIGLGSAEDSIVSSPAAGIHGIEAVLEYNGLFMNVREWVDTFIVTSIMGTDDAEVRDSRELNPGQHGETPGDALYAGRTIVLQGHIETKSLWKLRDMQKALRMAFQDISTERPLIFRTSDPDYDVQIMCRKKSKMEMPEQQDTINFFKRNFNITLAASNPRFISVSEQYQVSQLGTEKNWINNIPNPSFEVNVTGSATEQIGAGTDPQITRSTANATHREPAPAASVGSGVLTLQAAGDGYYYSTNGMAVAAGDRVYLRARVSGNASAGSPIRLAYRNQLAGDSETQVGIASIDRDGTPSIITKETNGDGVVLEGLLTVPAGLSAIQLAVGKVAGAIGNTVGIDGLMMVKLGPDQPIPDEYGDGSVPEWSWTGSANSSTSERSVILFDGIVFNLSNEGSQAALPRIEMVGPINHYIEITNERNGNYLRYNFLNELTDGTVGLVAAQTVVHDFRFQLPRLYLPATGEAIYRVLDPTSTDFQLEVGENPIHVHADELDVGASMGIRFNHTY